MVNLKQIWNWSWFPGLVSGFFFILNDQSFAPFLSIKLGRITLGDWIAWGLFAIGLLLSVDKLLASKSAPKDILAGASQYVQEFWGVSKAEAEGLLSKLTGGIFGKVSQLVRRVKARGVPATKTAPAKYPPPAQFLQDIVSTARETRRVLRVTQDAATSSAPVQFQQLRVIPARPANAWLADPEAKYKDRLKKALYFVLVVGIVGVILGYLFR